MNTNDFSLRHNGVHGEDLQAMLQSLGVSSAKELIAQTLPQDIQSEEPMLLPKAMSEMELLQHMAELGKKNKLYKSYIGCGYYGTQLPAVIQRNILENPGWYTAYTPYQAEIAQGRLQALLNFQTMVSDLTQLPLANASLLDEGTAAAEAMHMFWASVPKSKKNANVFFVSEDVYPQTLAVLKTKAWGLGIELKVGNHQNFEFSDEVFGALVQYPAKQGEIYDYSEFIQKAHENDVQVVMAADILALVKLKSPGELGADAAVGSTQRFGIPMGFGGPHAAYLACKEDYKRQIPGRIIGVSVDASGKKALRMALQTREQHIKRQRATSNICTAQVLLAVMAGMYAVYHGPEGLKFIANTLHTRTAYLAKVLKELGYEVLNQNYFDTLYINAENIDREKLKSLLNEKELNLNFFDDKVISIALDETDVASTQFLEKLIEVFAEYQGKTYEIAIPEEIENTIPENLLRKTEFLTHENFNSYHTETELMRYIKRLERKDLALNQSMIPLGSCTMKLNAAAEMLALSFPTFGGIHPFAPSDQTQGYLEMIHNLENYLSEITGFADTSLQPNSGAQGEYAGLMVIKAYLKSIGEEHRNVVVIPESAHGTNPASATMAGMKVVVVKNTPEGAFDLEDLKAQVKKNKENLAALMVTYPSTYGMFDDDIKKVTQLIHDNGGQVYMDGANMNAQVGLTNPGQIGADVCHLNLHKTFAIPHGGGGPGVGPICVAEHLVPFLPSNPLVSTGVDSNDSLDAISSAPYGSALVQTISYAYIRLLGAEGLTKSTIGAILNANYLKTQLEKDYKVLYQNAHGRVGHEMIIDFRPFKSLGIEVGDIAKRLMDYGFHAPTVSFPVAGTLMIEPTESEDKAELDRFVDALLSIKKEIEEVQKGKFTQDNNVLKNAPHTNALLTADAWELPYSREKAAYPVEWLKDNKFWPSVARIDDAYGDRNLMCTCPPTESYE
ncbi:aminomethyl-transferring glycine dehydrogenase [Ornithobacterium rhinotracheale]|uniref:aminomethyl-transferring glycine dehydrogenase n=1 Tax=Ornithobacterium rhinotracheale TaxID=28251 RepID=UPI003872D809